MAAPLPSTSSVGASSGGFKLKLKLGGSSAPPAAPTPPVVAPIPVPAPPVQRMSHPAPVPISSRHTPTTEGSSRGQMLPPSKVAKPHISETEAAAIDAARLRAQVKEMKGVSASKYRALKRKFDEVVETKESAALTLHRTQRLVVRLREEKTALLDRVLMLEAAAGLTTDEVAAAEEERKLTERQREFPLLHPPPQLSLEERPRELPVLTTGTDFTTSTYNDPVGPPPPPSTVPPRDRSRHFLSTLASDKLRATSEARRLARGLPAPIFPAVSVLGLDGSTVAIKIERILAGEDYEPPPDPRPAANGRGGPRRESLVPAPAKGKAKAESTLASLHSLPNPFSGAGAVADVVRGTADAIAAADNAARLADDAARLADNAARLATTETYDGSHSPGSAASYDEDHTGDVSVQSGSGLHSLHGFSPGTQQQPRKHRKAEVNANDKQIKPKRLKTHGIKSGTYQIPFIHRNPDGTPQLPMSVGIMILRKLGTVIPREHFHTERYIFPVGFECMRKYPSMLDPDATVEYLCRIVDGGNGAPRFEIDPADQPGVIIAAGTPTGAWSQIVKAANRVRERNHSNSVSGPDYYGLAQNIVKALIQELPRAREVPGYIWQTFVEEPDPATLGEEAKLKKPPPGPRKVVGAPRKLRAEDVGGSSSTRTFSQERGDDEDLIMVDSHNFDRPPQSPAVRFTSTSVAASQQPVFHPNDGYTNKTTLSSLVHATAADPYSLPAPIDPNLGPGGARAAPLAYTPYIDPYSLPPPQATYTSPPAAESNAHWPDVGSASPNFQLPVAYPSFNQPTSSTRDEWYGDDDSESEDDYVQAME